MSPEALLNRWIVPLDRSIDYLTLHGRKVEVPFEVKAVLSTNLDPSHLGDEAFFRRIHNKVYIGACTDDQFDWILSRVAQKRGLEVDASAAARMREVARSRGDGELRAYLPGVICELAQAILTYEGLARVITPSLVDRILDLYFTRLDTDAPEPTTDGPDMAELDRLEAEMATAPAPAPPPFRDSHV